MAERFREREAERPRERLLPSIRREERQLHSPIDMMGRCAAHLRIPAELTRQGSARAVSRADQDMRIARNVSDLRLEGSTPLHARFLRMLESL